MCVHNFERTLAECLRTFLLAGLVLITHIASSLYCCAHINVSILKVYNTTTVYFTSDYCRVSVDAITANLLLVEWRLHTGLKESEKLLWKEHSFLTLNTYNPLQIMCWHTWSTDGQCVNLVGRWVNLWVLAEERIWDEPSALFICRLHRLRTTCSTNIHESSSYPQCHECKLTSKSNYYFKITSLLLASLPIAISIKFIYCHDKKCEFILPCIWGLAVHNKV